MGDASGHGGGERKAEGGESEARGERRAAGEGSEERLKGGSEEGVREVQKRV